LVPRSNTIPSLMWSWSVVGILVSFALSAGIAFTTSGHPWAADVSYALGTSFLVLKFWTWDDARDLPSQGPWKFGLTTAAMVIAVSAIVWNHKINRSAPTGRPTSVGAKSADADARDSVHEGKTGEQTRAQLQVQEFTLVLRNDSATPEFYVNGRKSLPASYSSGIATLQLPTGSYSVRAEYPDWTCRAFINLPLENQRPVPGNCKLK
jgi:hypothetical protein